MKKIPKHNNFGDWIDNREIIFNSSMKILKINVKNRYIKYIYYSLFNITMILMCIITFYVIHVT